MWVADEATVQDDADIPPPVKREVAGDGTVPRVRKIFEALAPELGWSAEDIDLEDVPSVAEHRSARTLGFDREVDVLGGERAARSGRVERHSVVRKRICRSTAAGQGERDGGER